MKRRVVIGIVIVALVGLGLVLRKRTSSPKLTATVEAPRAPDRRAPESGGDRRSGGEDQRVLVDDDREGTLRLEGIVLDAAEQPVAGAIVTVSANPPRTVESGDDGSFFVDKLVGRPYTLVARAPQGIAGPVTARLTATSDPVTLRLRPGASVEVTVIDAVTRAPIDGATIELRDLETITATTGADGKALLTQVPSGWQTAVAWAPGYGKTFTGVAVARQSGAEPVLERETISLRRGAAVSGTVLAVDGTAIEGASVLFAGVSEWGNEADSRRDAAVSDARGAWRFEALPAGTFRFVARREGSAPGSSAQVTLDGTTDKTGVEIRLEEGATVAGRVVSKAGEPVGWASVRVAPTGEGQGQGDIRQTVAGEDGTFSLTGVPRKKAQAVAIHETATSETVDVDLTAGDRRDLELKLDLDGTISGVVVDPRGEPVPEAMVSARPNARGLAALSRRGRGEWGLRGRAQELTDAGGRFVLRGLREGDYQLRASRTGAPGRNWQQDPVDAEVGDQNVKIVLPEDGSVVGRVLFADGSAPELYTASAGMGQGTPFSAKDGTFELENVPPGKRSLTVTGPSFDQKRVEVDVEEGKALNVGTLTVKKGRIITGRVLTAAGAPAAGATVFAGRRLFGDGARPSTRGFGPGGGGVVRSATADDEGVYTLFGVGPRELALLADHETLGRSQAVQVAGGTQPATIDLVLKPFGALEGTVTRGGQPVEELMVNATAQTVTTTNFMIQTGPDGAFRFDRLAADTYVVSAMTGRNPMGGMAFHSQVVILEEGRTAKVALTIPTETATLVVTPHAAEGEVKLAQVRTARGLLTATTARALETEIAALGEATSSFGISFGGGAARMGNLPAGSYTVCAVPMPNELQGMQQIFQYIEREGDNLRAFCAPHEVKGTGEIPITIEVTVPAFVPPPDEG